MKTLHEMAGEYAESKIDHGEVSNFTTLELQGIIGSAMEMAVSLRTAELQTENTLFRSALIQIERLSQTTCLSFEDQSFDATRIAREALTVK